MRVGPFIERAHPRPGDDHGTETIAVALVHPDAPIAAACRHGHDIGYTDRGWLRCETHAAANLPLPDDVGMAPAHYGVYVEARRPDGPGYTLLRLGPYSQTWLASRDADRLNTELTGRAALVRPGFTVTVEEATFDVSDHDSYINPHGNDVTVLLAMAVAGGGSATATAPAPRAP
ncbi:hypothetical protein ABT143_25055 [Streptomyces sp. NPDC002033]|uniref:hypothetical protein n=1 Tax=unclassified Streptomyces TaxID=2593676 RepID=UPI00332B8736